MKHLTLLIAMFLIGGVAEVARGQASAYLEGARQPQLCADADRAYLTYVQDGTIRFGVIEGDGPWETLAVDVATPPDLMSGMSRGPRIAAAGEALVITAIADKPRRLVAWRSIDGGKTWQESIPDIAREADATREGLHDLAGNADGKLAVVWLDLRNVEAAGTELWLATSDDGGETWSEPRSIVSNAGGTVCECCHPAVTLDGEGEPVVLFRNVRDGNRDMYLWRDGKAEKLGVGSWPLMGCPMAGGDVAVYVNPMNDRETVFTVWRREGTLYSASPGEAEGIIAEGRGPTIAVSREGWPALFYSTADSGLLAYVPSKGTFRIDGEGGSYPSAVSVPGATVVAYESGGGVEIYPIDRFERYEEVKQ